MGHTICHQYTIAPVNISFWCAGRIKTTTMSSVDSSHPEQPSATPCNSMLDHTPIMDSATSTVLASNGSSTVEAAPLHPASCKAVTPVQAGHHLSASHQVAIWQPRPTALVSPTRRQCHLVEFESRLAIPRYPIISVKGHAYVDQTMHQPSPTSQQNLKIGSDMVRRLAFP